MTAMLQVRLTPEQCMLQETARRYFQETYCFADRTRTIASPLGYDTARWRTFAELGWLGLPFPERYGGSGGSSLDLVVLLREFGRALVVEPYLPTMLAGLAALAAGRPDQHERLLPPLVAGELQLALALFEPQSGYDIGSIDSSARRVSSGWRLHGHKAVVLGAPSADFFVVNACCTEEQSVSLFLVERTAKGVDLRSYETIDGRRASEVLLNDVHVNEQDRLDGGSARPALYQVELYAALFLVAEAIGCLQGAVDQTAEYLNVREQFGQKLASFQALRHRLADMYALSEESNALCIYAGQALADGNESAAEAISAAKAYTGEFGRRVCEEAVQLHGAIAITEEFIVGHYLKRLIAVDRLFGDSEFHLDRYLRLRGDFLPDQDSAMQEQMRDH